MLSGPAFILNLYPRVLSVSQPDPTMAGLKNVLWRGILGRLQR